MTFAAKAECWERIVAHPSTGPMILGRCFSSGVARKCTAPKSTGSSEQQHTIVDSIVLKLMRRRFRSQTEAQ